MIAEQPHLCSPIVVAGEWDGIWQVRLMAADVEIRFDPASARHMADLLNSCADSCDDRADLAKIRRRMPVGLGVNSRLAGPN